MTNRTLLRSFTVQKAPYRLFFSTGATTHCGQHFNNQLTHTTLKNVELLKQLKISKTALYPHTVHGTHASQVIICSH